MIGQRSMIAVVTLTLAVALLAPPAAAQSGTALSVPRTQTSLELAPYAGYMFSQDLLTGPLGTRLSVAGAPLYGAQVTLPLVPGVGLVGNVAYGRADLEARVPLLGGIAFGESTAWMYDAGVQIGATGGGSRGVAPFVQFGAGGLRRELEVAGLTASATDFAWYAGAGVDMEILPNVAVRLLARDHVARFDFQEAIFLDLDSRTMHNVALSAGVRFSF